MKSTAEQQLPATPVVSTEGTHIIADLHGCRSDLLDDSTYLVELLTSAAVRAKATVLNVAAHSFEPHGVTILVLLAESHLSIHTWPETGYAAVDVMTCGDAMRPQEAVDMIVSSLEASQVVSSLIARGVQ